MWTLSDGWSGEGGVNISNIVPMCQKEKFYIILKF